ncbi:hypothetical protein ACI2KT_30710 [Ensifer adhaerens]|uniref:hypothetical protein n=1 Tax=Ensifer adhaerens TaxID=106592 RepID=UPI00384A4620
MADSKQNVIEWGDFRILSITPPEAKVASPALSPDGRQLSILIEGLTARIDIATVSSAVSILVGSITPKVPHGMSLFAMRADFRGQAILTNGARATIQLGLGRSSDNQTLTSHSDVEDYVEIVRSLYSPVEATLPNSESGDVTYGAITISIMVTVASTGSESAVLVEFDSVDLELWTG